MRLSVGHLAMFGAFMLGGCSGGSVVQIGNEEIEAPEPPPPLPANNVETMTGATLAQFSGDPAAGQAVFSTCQACHSIAPGVNGIGPSLHGIVGRQAAMVPSFPYSEAMRRSGFTWTPEKIFQFVENPRRVLPRSRMTFQGLRDPQRRADLIAYLATLRD